MTKIYQEIQGRFDLPEVKDIRIKRIQFKPVRLKNFKSRLLKYKEAIEFVVRTAGPIPIRALGPALYVGEVPVHESTRIANNTYRLLAFDVKALEPGARISWGWMQSLKRQWKPTKFAFHLKYQSDCKNRTPAKRKDSR